MPNSAMTVFFSTPAIKKTTFCSHSITVTLLHISTYIITLQTLHNAYSSYSISRKSEEVGDFKLKYSLLNHLYLECVALAFMDSQKCYKYI